MNDGTSIFDSLVREVKRSMAATALAKRVVAPAFFALQHRRYARLVSRNAQLKNRHAGQRCFILGTGPSINALDFSLLRGQYVFGCSLLFKHRDFHQLNVSFYSATVPLRPLYDRPVLLEVCRSHDGIRITPDNVERVMTNCYSEAEETIPNLDQLQKDGPVHFFSQLDQQCANPGTIVFLNAACRKYLRARGLFQDDRAYYVVKAASSLEHATEQSNDLAGRPTFLDGALFFAVAAAIYMGFTEIVLCGCGYTYAPTQEFHFFDEPVISSSFSEAEAAVVSDRFAASRAVRVKSLQRAIDGYRPQLVSDKPVDHRHHIIKAFAEQRGVKILNLVPSGFESPVYPAVSERYLQEVASRPAAGDTNRLSEDRIA